MPLEAKQYENDSNLYCLEEKFGCVKVHICILEDFLVGRDCASVLILSSNKEATLLEDKLAILLYNHPEEYKEIFTKYV